MLNWRQSTKNTEVELFSTTQGLTHYSLNKDLQHLKWQPSKSWISFPDCLVAMDKQQTQYQLMPKWKWKMLTNCKKNPKSECPDIWIRLPWHTWPKSWSSMEDPVVPLERNLYGHPLAELLWERQFEKILLKHGWEKIPNWECLFVHREKGLFLSVYVDDIKLAGKKQNLDPMWKLLNKEVDLGEPTSFLVCFQWQCQVSKDVVDNHRTMFESRISAEGTEKLPFPQKLRIFHGLMIWLVMQRNVWNDIVSWQTRRHNNSTKYLLYALMTTTLKKKKQNLLENCQIHAFKLFWSASSWHVLEDLIFYVQWTNLHDRLRNGPELVTIAWIDWFPKFIIHVSTDNLVMWVILLNNADWGLFQDSDFAGDLEDSKSASAGTLCVFGSHTFVPISWMCKKQTAVSQSSTESEIISLDTGLRLDGLPALELWDLIVSVFGNVSHVSDWSGKPESDDHKHHKSHKQNRWDERYWWCSFKCPIRASRSFTVCVRRQRSSDQNDHKGKEAGHVSRTHRAALDWLFDRINLDSKIQIKYIDTNLLTFFRPKEISRVMSGIICCACLKLAISVPQFALLQWRSDLNKIQEKNESQQNQNLWWIPLRGRHRRVVFNFSEPGEEYYGKSRSWEICCGGWSIKATW